MALNLGRMEYRPDLSPDDVARFNRLLDAVEHMWDNLQNPAAPIAVNDFHYYLNPDITSGGTIVGPIEFDNTVSFNGGNNVNFNNGVEFCDSITPPPNPGTGCITLYQIGGVFYTVGPTGVVTPLVGGRFVHPWDALQFGTRWHVAGQHQFAQKLPSAIGNYLANVMYAVPILATRGITIDKIAVNVTAALLTFNIRVGLYQSLATPGNLYPNNLIRDYGTIAVAGLGGDYMVSGGPDTLTAGKVYWLVFLLDTAESAILSVTTVDCVAMIGFPQAGGGFSTVVPGIGYQVAFAFGALPNPFTGGGSVTDILTHTYLPALFYECSG